MRRNTIATRCRLDLLGTIVYRAFGQARPRVTSRYQYATPTPKSIHDLPLNRKQFILMQRTPTRETRDY